MNQAAVQINRVLGVSEETPPGKQYTIHQFQCDGFINGQPVDTFVVKTLSGKMASEIQAGTFTQFNAEVDNFKGNITYKIFKSYYSNDQNGGGFAPPAQQGFQPPAQNQGYQNQPNPTYAPPANKGWNPPTPPPSTGGGFSAPAKGYTLDEIKALYADIHTYAKTLSPVDEVVQSATATMFIQATKANLKAPIAQAMGGASQPAPADLQAHLKHVLTNAGLLDRVVAGKVPDEVLEEWYANSDGNDNSFIIEVNKQLVEHSL